MRGFMRYSPPKRRKSRANIASSCDSRTKSERISKERLSSRSARASHSILTRFGGSGEPARARDSKRIRVEPLQKNANRTACIFMAFHRGRVYGDIEQTRKIGFVE